MSRVAEWKLEKIKVKVVFRLQFHATHIPQTGWDKLFISFIPADSVKATAKTTKANVRNGTCKWADPIYETTRLLQDAKSKQYDEKRYKFVVAMGSSRSGILGEASINLADYADALKPSSIALALHGCNFETILHVTVQLLTSKTGFREFEQQRELRERRLQMGTDLRRHDGSSTGKLSTLGETTSHHIDKDNARVRSKEKPNELPSLEEEVGLTDEYADSATGFDGSSNTSESLYAENHDTSSSHEIDCLKSTVSGDINGCSPCRSPQTGKNAPSDHRISARTSNDWVQGSDYSTDCQEGSRLLGNLEVADSCVFKLKQEVSSLQSHADEIGIETHKFSQQLAAEIASAEELAKEVCVLKSECSNFRDDLEQLKNLNLSLQSASRCINCTDKDRLFQNIQLRWLQGISVVEDKIREFHSKAFLGFHETDFGFFHSDLGSLLSFLQDLKQGDGAVPLLNVVPSVRTDVKEIREASVVESKQFLSGTGFDVDLYQPEAMLSCLSMPDFMSQNLNSLDSANLMRGKIFELLRELDDAKAEKESLVRKMDQMECYYEALIQEHEENQKQMLGELQNLKNEHSTCLYTIACNKAEMESMHQNINEQILRFTEERRALDSFNKELERRANVSEAALRRARLNYSIAVNQLQKDLDLLSFQVLSMFETNESLVKQTFSETSQPCFQSFPDSEQSQQESLQDQNKNAGLKKQFLDGDILFEDLKKSLHLQEERFQKVEKELYEVHSINVHLDIFSRALQESLLEATADIMLMKDKINELAQQLKFSTESKESLLLRLHTAMDDVEMLNEDRASCIAKCSDMVLQNQILEAKLKSLYNENGVLTRKVTELEGLMKEYRSYQSKYEACSSEKMEQANFLEKETLRNGNLEKEISSLKEELATVKDEYNELASSKENQQKIVSHLQDKLGSLLASYSEQFNELFLPSKSPSQDFEFKDFTGIIMQLEKIQQTACGKIRQLMEEKKSLENERKAAQASLSSTNSEILIMKQKFKHDIQDMVTKLDISNTLVENLQLELEAIGNKVHVSWEAEEKFAQQNKELFADITLLELELQQLTSKNGELAEKILDLDNVTEELGRSRLSIAALIQEKQDLMTTLQEKTEESVILASELDKLKESFRFLYDEMQGERSFRNKLEGKVTSLTSQLNESHEQLLHFAQQKTELAHFRQLVSDLELEKSRVFNLLLQREERLEKLLEASSYVREMGCQLSEVHEYLLAADVENTFLRSQFETQIEVLSQHLLSSDWNLEMLRKQHIDVETMLNHCLASEVHYIEENAKLVTNVESLKSELEDSVALNSLLSDSNSVIMAQLEEYKEKVAILEVNFCKDKSQHAQHVEQLKYMLVNSEQEIIELMSTKEELEIIMIVLKAKLEEQLAHMTSLEEHNGELLMLQDQCNELTHKLGEQILKTEEFKNLSIHLKELKDKADAECLQTREKQEPEVPTVPVQESLRIAFIREQYETKMQELRQRLSISKKHGEEMLLKLQDAVDEVENRRKSEASHLKRNEELSQKVLELEAELNLVASEKREKIKAYDLTKAELECTLLSLECCKEEKQKLKASLRESKEEKSRIAAELVSTKELLVTSASAINIPKEENGGSNRLGHMPGQPVVDTAGFERVNTSTTGNGSPGNCLKQGSLINNEEEENASSTPRGEIEPSSALMSVQPIADVLVSKCVHEVQEHQLPDQVSFPHNGSKHLTVTNNLLNSPDLKSSLDHLHEELEKMKNQNSLLQYDHIFDSEFENLQTELTQLNKANEELRSMFPFFNEFSGTGNALERVFALEIELAEALRAKKKSSSHFQSSFLKQHSDEAAVLQSFRDINELIKDMLELKGRYAAKDSELKDMHDRYSQLSLQFAEVEGDRQKLMMMLKNIRASKKLPYLNHSPANHPS